MDTVNQENILVALGKVQDPELHRDIVSLGMVKNLAVSNGRVSFTVELTTPDVGLLFDTGHMAFAGGDAASMLAKHVARVCHVHCKDVRPPVIAMARNRAWSFLEAVINGAFTVPGDGGIDFAPIVATLRTHGYSGWLVVEAEQDPVVAPAYRYADMGYRHLAKLVGDRSGSLA